MADDVAIIEGRIDAFRAWLASEESDEVVVRRHVLFGSPYALTDDESFAVARDIAEGFNIHPTHDVFLVGSARLGFSISPNKRWKHFNDESDIDLAIVSSSLFEVYWQDVSAYLRRLDSWDRRDRLLLYLGQGWLRPDLLPRDLAGPWFDFFQELSRRHRLCGGVKISAGLFYNMKFLESYHCAAIQSCRNALEQEPV